MKQSVDVDRGWAWVVLVAVFMIQFTSGVFLYSQGVVQIILLEVFDGGILTTSWILGISGSLLSLPGPLAGIMANKMGCRNTMFIGSALMFIGYTSSAFVTDLAHLYITLSVLTGLGMSLVYSPSFVVLGFYFERNLNLATALAVAGAGVGMMAASPLVLCVEQVFGWRGMFLIVAGIAGNCFVWAFICRPNDIEIAYMLKRMRPKAIITTKEKPSVETKWWEDTCTKVRAVCGLPMILFCGSVFMWSLEIAFVLLHLPNYVAVHGMAIAKSGLLITLMGLCNILARVLVGVTVNAGYVDQFAVYTGSFAVMAFITLVFPFLPVTFPLSMIYAGIFGLCTGGPYVVIAPMVKALVGLEHMAVSLGIELLICGFGFMVGPPIAGGLLVTFGSYTWPFVFAGLSCGLSSILGALLMKYKRKRPPEEIDIPPAEV